MEERRGVPHHLIDILEPTEEFSAGSFLKAALEKAAEIVSRGHVPVIVGGTGFYLKWLMEGRPETPGSTPASRTEAARRIDEVRVGN